MHFTTIIFTVLAAAAYARGNPLVIAGIPINVNVADFFKNLLIQTDAPPVANDQVVSQNDALFASIPNTGFDPSANNGTSRPVVTVTEIVAAVVTLEPKANTTSHENESKTTSTKTGHHTKISHHTSHTNSSHHSTRTNAAMTKSHKATPTPTHS